jgi:hypothetical protein
MMQTDHKNDRMMLRTVFLWFIVYFMQDTQTQGLLIMQFDII